MRFSRSQRGLSIRTVQAAFKDIEYAKLKNETTLTVDEVYDILAELWDTVKSEVDGELSHQSHTYILHLLPELRGGVNLQASHVGGVHFHKSPGSAVAGGVVIEVQGAGGGVPRIVTALPRQLGRE